MSKQDKGTNTAKTATDWQRMTQGRLYNCTQRTILLRHIRALDLCDSYNRTRIWNLPRRNYLLRKLLPNAQKGCFILNDFHCEYGINITIGANFFANFDCKFLDVAPIIIGDNCMCGVGVTLATPVHPLLARDRIIQQFPDGLHDLEYAKPITIGNNVWLASNVTVQGGVTIGDNVVVGAGSVVTRDLPPNTFCCGVPCRVVRKLDEEDAIDVWQCYQQDLPPISKRQSKRSGITRPKDLTSDN